MSVDRPKGKMLPLLGHAFLFSFAMTAMWFATWVVVPSAVYFMNLYGTEVPALFAPAFQSARVLFYSVTPIAVLGVVLLVIGLVGKGPARLVAASRTGLAVLTGVVVCLTLYLLASAGVGQKLAGGSGLVEVKYYKKTLNEYALLEAAEGRYVRLRESFAKNRDLKMVEVKSAAEYSKDEAREKIKALIDALPKASNMAMKKQILATLCLFKERKTEFGYDAKDILGHAVQAGAPEAKSYEESLQWIAANLNRDGWEPLPLFKFTR